MATIRRNTAPEKEKKVGILLPTSPQTATKRTNHDSTTAPQKRVPIYPKSPLNSNINVSKQTGKKPSLNPSTTAPKSTLTTRRSTLDKTPLIQTQKTRIISTNNPSVRPSSTLISAKPIVAQKPIPGNNLKVVTKDAVKLTVKKSITTIKKQEITKKSITATSATTEHKITRPNISKGPQPEIHPKHQDKSSHDVVKRTISKKQEMTKKTAATSAQREEQKITRLNISKSPESEIQPEHQEESCFAAAEEQNVLQAVSNDEKGSSVNSVAKDQEPLKNIEETEDVGNDKDTKAVIDEASTVLDNQTETQESYVEEINSKKQELEEHGMNNTMNETNSSNNGESVADNPNEEAQEKEVCEVKEAVKQNEEEGEDETVTAVNKEEELPAEIPHEIKETQEQVAVEEKKQEKTENIATKQHQLPAQGKKDSAVSNDVIEETASKLREQRKNKVKALAGAFETVISLQ